MLQIDSDWKVGIIVDKMIFPHFNWSTKFVIQMLSLQNTDKRPMNTFKVNKRQSRITIIIEKSTKCSQLQHF